MPNIVYGSGPVGAPLLLVGEAPGRQECAAGVPFVGPAGKLLDEFLVHAGLDRSQIRIENVCERFPPGGAIANMPKVEQEAWMTHVWARIHIAYPDTPPNLIMLIGAFALKALYGPTTKGITAWRGSLLLPRDNPNTQAFPRFHNTKLLPTLHPAYLLYPRSNTAWKEACYRDFALAKEEATHPHLKRPALAILTNPTKEQALNWSSAILDPFADPTEQTFPLAIDIETVPVQQRIETISFARSAQEAIAFPLTTQWAKNLTRELLASPHPKIFHNGLYDVTWLEDAGYSVNNYQYDTRYMHHILDPRSISKVAGVDGHSLHYLQSLYTRLPYHKDLVDDLGKESAGTKLQTKLYYNALDSLATYHIYQALYNELARHTGSLEFYLKTAKRYPALLSLIHTGINVDDTLRAETLASLRLKCAQLRTQLDTYTGDDNTIFATKSESIIKLNKFLYDTCHLPRKEKSRPGTNHKGKTLTSDTVALRQHLLDTPNRCPLRCTHGAPKNPHTLDCPGPIGPNFLIPLIDYRTHYKLQSFFSADASRFTTLDTPLPTTRLYSTYSPVTEAGRLASSRDPYTRGTNLQNQPKNPLLRRIFIPDSAWICPTCGTAYSYPADTCINSCDTPAYPIFEERMVFLEADLSQAESRVVYMLSGDPTLIQLAQIPPWEKDMHRYYASKIFQIDERAITKDQRQVGKKAVHASQRGMRGNKLSDAILKDFDRYIPPITCQQFITNYLNDHPGVLTYFSDIQQQVIRTRTLTNAFGRRWTCHHEDLSDDLYRDAYSFLPQSNVADLLLNTLAKLHAWNLTFPTPLFHINTTVHDSILFSCFPQDAYRIARYTQAIAETPIDYADDGNTLIIPVEFSLGSSWIPTFEYKQLPDQATFEQNAYSLLDQ